MFDGLIRYNMQTSHISSFGVSPLPCAATQVRYIHHDIQNQSGYPAAVGCKPPIDMRSLLEMGSIYGVDRDALVFPKRTHSVYCTINFAVDHQRPTIFTFFSKDKSQSKCYLQVLVGC